MKKLLAIMVLCLFFSGNSLAEKYLLNCIDTKDPNFQRNFELEFNSKDKYLGATLHDLKFDKTLAQNFIPQYDKELGMFSNYSFDGGLRGYYAQVRVIDFYKKENRIFVAFYTKKINKKIFERLTGEFNQIGNTESNKSTFQGQISYETAKITNKSQWKNERLKYLHVLEHAMDKGHNFVDMECRQ